MDRETALQNYREAVSRKIAAFRSHMGDSVLEHAEDWEAVVEKAMKLLGEQMEKQGKEYVCFLYFSLLKSDTINRNYRVQLHGLDMSWYMDKEPVEVYVDVKELLTPLDELWNELVCANQGYGVSVNEYDIQNLLFDELTIMDNMICQVLRYRLRDWEKKGIFEPVTRSPYWVLRWGEYRDQTEILVQTDRVEKDPASGRPNCQRQPESRKRWCSVIGIKAPMQTERSGTWICALLRLRKAPYKTLYFRTAIWKEAVSPEPD